MVYQLVVVVVGQFELGLFFDVSEQWGARIFLEVLDYDETEWLAVDQTLHVLLMLLGILLELTLRWQTLVVLLLLFSMVLN